MYSRVWVRVNKYDAVLLFSAKNTIFYLCYTISLFEITICIESRIQFILSIVGRWTLYEVCHYGETHACIQHICALPEERHRIVPYIILAVVYMYSQFRVDIIVLFKVIFMELKMSEREGEKEWMRRKRKTVGKRASGIENGRKKQKKKNNVYLHTYTHSLEPHRLLFEQTKFE